MGNLLARIAKGRDRHEIQGIALNIGTLGELFSQQKALGGFLGMDFNPQEHIEGDSGSLVAQVHKTYGPVPAAVVARSLLLGQFRPRWRSEIDDHLFGDDQLSVLERPLFTSRVHMLRQAEHDASYAGTAYFHRTIHRPTGQPGMRMLPPGRTRIIVGTSLNTDDLVGQELTPSDLPDAYVRGYRYNINGKQGELAQYRYYTPQQVSHWAPEPDPDSLFAGTSWVASVIRDIAGDKQVAAHVDGFLEKGAMPGLAIVFPTPKENEEIMTADDLDAYQEVITDFHSGPRNTGRSLVLEGGPQVIPVTANLDTLGLKDITAGYEAHIASRARIPPTVLGIREGMQGSALNAGNYSSARRMWGDGWVHPSLESLAAALEPLLNRPANTELWYDQTAVAFLQEDAQDQANIASTTATAVSILINAGFEPDAAALAATSGDMSNLVGQHTGLPSVQLQPDAITEGDDSDDEPDDD